jgi:hypothetical protein
MRHSTTFRLKMELNYMMKYIEKWNVDDAEKKDEK